MLVMTKILFQQACDKFMLWHDSCDVKYIYTERQINLLIIIK